MARQDLTDGVTLARGGVRAVVAGVLLAGVWAAAFATEVLPFFPTIVAGGALTGLAGLWVRRGSRGWHADEPERRRFPTFRVTPRQAVLALVVAAVHLGAGHLLFALGARIVPALTDTAAAVYTRAGSLPLWAAVVLGGSITAPLEEIYWRGAVQPLLVSMFRDRWPGLARLAGGPLLGSVAVYTLFHLATGQLALVAAALLGGVVWAWLLDRTGSVGATMIAHGAWTCGMLLVPPV